MRDPKAMTVEEADGLYLAIAMRKAMIDRLTAAHKQRLAELEQKHKDLIAADLAAMDAMVSDLEAYILAHKDRFESPRKHPVGQIGSYGITTAPAGVIITDRDAYLAYAEGDDRADLVRVEKTPDKDAALRHILQGEQIPGCEAVPPGDVVKIAYRKGYAEQL